MQFEVLDGSMEAPLFYTDTDGYLPESALQEHIE